MKVEQSIHTRFAETGAALFVPEQFIDEGLGNPSEVIAALRTLEDDGFLRARAGVRCAYNHELWGGRPEEVPEYASTLRCPVADCPSHSLQPEELQDEDFQPYVVLRYQISQAWMNQLGSAAADQKKKTRRKRAS